MISKFAAVALAFSLALSGIDVHAKRVGHPLLKAVPVVVKNEVPVVLDEPIDVIIPEPVIVDVDAAREPFQFDGFIIRETLDDPPQVSLFDVPTDRNLVIETISVAAFQADVRGPTLLAERGGPVLASPTLVQNGTSPSYSSLHDVRIRVDAGATIDGIVNALGRFRFMISGYLLPTAD